MSDIGDAQISALPAAASAERDVDTSSRLPPPFFILVGITLCGTFPLHVFIPALPSAAHELGATASAIGATITLYVIGLSIGQLVYGPLSDRYGRRPALLGGLIIFTLSSVGAAVAPTLEALEVARIMQALGGCSGLVLGRAIARDVCSSTTLIRRLATLSIAMAAATAIAPVIGAQLVLHLGWRAIFYTLGALNALVLLSVWCMVPETRDVSDGHSLARYIHSYVRLLKSPAFVSYTVGGSSAGTGIYAFLSASPFILEKHFGLSAQAFAFSYCLLVVALACGQSTAKGIAGRVCSRAALISASALMAAASASLAVAYLVHAWSVVTVMAPMVVMFYATGLSSPFAISGALDVDASMVGAAAGLYGSLQMGYGALCTAAAGFLPDNPALSMIATLVVSSVIAGLAFRFAPRARLSS
ncbi:multidrug effflux MFS transporter [Paraburkholderia terrae]|uniref:multidrug effflux MFS transporter n=1 Tax=Paraburkholderia terrae TaxID=311230 RepID=UPI00296AD7A3|nr:multidrug effflux MFS transporter [Paraburkholderia terrae]MDW3659428.1 multidrug effflux MFS transporter [Paraburkholderia terrae]